MKKWNGDRIILFIVTVACFFGSLSTTAQAPLSLQKAVFYAQEQDPWLRGSRYREQATKALGEAASQLPSPMLALGFANVPIDSFDVNQEPMTQFQVGISQVFPRGKTRLLKQQQLHELSAQQPLIREDRRRKVAVIVSVLWLDMYQSRESIRLIERDRKLFENLVDIALSSYTSAEGKTRQQHLLNAQVELARLDDRLSVLQQKFDTTSATLSQWVVPTVSSPFVISYPLPEIIIASPQLNENTEHLLAKLLIHPSIKSFDQKINASNTGIQLAKQQYKAQWGINARYGYRDDDSMGNKRSDFFSLGVSVDLPMLTNHRQDKKLQAAFAEESAIKTDKSLALRAMAAQVKTMQFRLQHLNQRKTLYQQHLLPAVHDQSEASLTAYTHDDGDFSDVVHASITELNTNIDFLIISIDRLKTMVELNYFIAPSDTKYGAYASVSGGINQ